MSFEKKKKCKVDLISQKYSLEKIDDRIIEMRIEEDRSLRDLRDYFNFLVLKKAHEDIGIDITDREIETRRDILQHNNDEEKKQMEKILEKQGIPSKSIQDDFISHTTIKNHLKKCIGLDTKKKESNISSKVNNIRSLRRRLEKITETTIEDLRNKDEIELPKNVKAKTQVYVTPENKEEQINIDEIFDIYSIIITSILGTLSLIDYVLIETIYVLSNIAVI